MSNIINLVSDEREEMKDLVAELVANRLSMRDAAIKVATENVLIELENSDTYRNNEGAISELRERMEQLGDNIRKIRSGMHQ